MVLIIPADFQEPFFSPQGNRPVKKLPYRRRVQPATAAVLLALALSGLSGPWRKGAGQEAPPRTVVHAVLFYSPTCPHCHQVINEDLIPLEDQYGDRLVLLGFDTSQPWANELFYEAIQYYDVPEDRWAVPFLVVGDEVLIGSLEIPARFPSIIENGLASGGIDLPSVPGMVTFLREQGVIDPRYPDRRVAVQAHSEEAAGADPDSVPPSGAQRDATEGDTVPGDTLAPPAGRVAGDSLREGGEAPPGDTAVGQGERVTVPSSGQPSGAALPGPAQDSASPAALESPSDSAAPPGRASPDSAGRGAVGPSADTREETSPSRLGLQAAARELASMGMGDRFRLDPVGNSFSVLMLLFLGWTLLARGYPPRVRSGPWPGWVIPSLLAIGAMVALYLAYVEVTGNPAVCGPVGDCNTVQQSSFARLFGVLPVGVLGLVGYAVMFVLWGLGKSGSPERRPVIHRLLWVCALMGTLFSLYLTFLEPFVIGATCAWCLTSAGAMALLLWATAPLAARAWSGAGPGTE